MNSLVRTVTVAVIVPLLTAMAGIIAILVVLPELPDPIAIHWNAAGEPDGDGPVWISLVVLALVPIAFGAFVLLFARPRSGDPVTVNLKVLTVAAPFLATVLSIVLAGSAVLQRAIASAADAPNITWLIPVALGAGLVLALAGWFVLPKAEPAHRTSAPVAEMPLAASEQAVWMQRLAPTRTVAVVLSIAAVLLAGVVVLVWFVTPPPLAVGLTVVMTLLAVAMASTLVWRVSVGAGGLRVRSALGIPAYRVALGEVDQVRSIDVDPAREFGGWGIRWGGHRRWGVIVRRGPAIEVRRRDGSTFVVTTPEADEGAALLASLAGRS